MATFCNLDLGEEMRCTEFFYFFLNLIVINVIFSVDPVQ